MMGSLNSTLRKCQILSDIFRYHQINSYIVRHNNSNIINSDIHCHSHWETRTAEDVSRNYQWKVNTVLFANVRRLRVCIFHHNCSPVFGSFSDELGHPSLDFNRIEPCGNWDLTTPSEFWKSHSRYKTIKKNSKTARQASDSRRNPMICGLAW